jgi:glycosyltransferase involved in cell wall biosynthesis
MPQVSAVPTSDEGAGRKVAVVNHDAELLGAAISVLQTLPDLEAKGWRFSFWLPGTGDFQRELEERGYSVAGEPRQLRYSWAALSAPPGPAARLWSVPGYLRRYRAWLRSQAPAVVHANTSVTIPEAVASRRAGFPTLLHVHEVLKENLTTAVAARLMRSLDAVVTPSRGAAEPLQRRNVPVRVVHEGVQTPPAPTKSRDGRPLVVGTLGIVCHRKGSDVFLSAAQRVREELGDLEFRMIGDFAPEPETSWSKDLVETARKSGIRCGAPSDVFKELAEWDVFVLPSRRDAFPIALLEGMATGLPVVATRVPGILEQVTPDVGILVDPDDADALGGAILKLAREPQLRERMGTAARERVEQEFSVARQAQGMHEAYLAALETAAQRNQ